MIVVIATSIILYTAFSDLSAGTVHCNLSMIVGHHNQK